MPLLEIPELEPDDESFRLHLEDLIADEPTCMACGCSASNPCPGGCFWATPNLCSRCYS